MIDCEYEDAPCDSCSQRYVCSACSNSPVSEIIGGACYCDTDEIYDSGTCYRKNLKFLGEIKNLK